MPEETAASAAEQLAQALVSADEAPEEASGSEEVAAEAQAQPEATSEFELEPEIPDDVREFLEEPNFEEEAETEVEASQPEEYNEEEYTDPALAEERKKRIAAEKKAAWLEQQRVQANLGKWREEAVKYFPLSQPVLDDITATSRRGFLREAQRAHEKTLPVFKQVAEMFEAKLKTAQTQADEAERDIEKAQWGPATSGPGGVPPEAAALQAKRANYDLAKSRGNLVDMIKNSNYFDVPKGAA